MPTTTETEQAAVKAAQHELASLQRVSHRVALVDRADRLTAVLDQLLPRLLRKLHVSSSSSDTITTTPSSASKLQQDAQQVLLSLISHILTRAKNDAAIQLPCRGLLQLLVNDSTQAVVDVNSFTLNFTLTFLNVGLPRYAEPTILLPLLLVRVAHATHVSQMPAAPAAAAQLVNLLWRCLLQISNDKSLSSEAASLALVTSRKLLRDHDLAGAFVELFEDGILYQPVMAGNVPPPGLSQLAHNRCKQIADHQALQKALLDVVAPSRQWQLLLGSTSTSAGTGVDEDDAHADAAGDRDGADQELGYLRTLSLLVLASGSPDLAIAECGAHYLKLALGKLEHPHTLDYGLLGLRRAVLLPVHLIGLCLGESMTENILVKHNVTFLGRHHQVTLDGPTQFVLSTKRRPVGDTTLTAICQFCSQHVFSSARSIVDAAPKEWLALGDIVLVVATRQLATVPHYMSPTAAKPFVATTQLLNDTAIVLARQLDVTDEGATKQGLVGILSKFLQLACQVLNVTTETAYGAASYRGENGSLGVRDPCYGIVCALSRNQFGLEPAIFSRGAVDGKDRSVSTAALLFDCIVREAETLRPRAVAALDALLAAYRKRFLSATRARAQMVAKADNPWLPASQSNDDTIAKAIVDNARLAKSLLPLLWAAAQAHRPKQSRTAAARWAASLIVALDRTSGCHLLLFLSGDADPTAAGIAWEGLGMQRDGESSISFEAIVLPSFADIVHRLSHVDDDAPASTIHRFAEFTPKGKALALRFVMECLMSDFYEADSSSVKIYSEMVYGPLAFLHGSRMALEASWMDLLDAAAGCMQTLVETSEFVRTLIVQEESALRFQVIENMALQASSANARRSLAAACGAMYCDESLAIGEPTAQETFGSRQFGRVLVSCLQEMRRLSQVHGDISRQHGACFLAAQVCRACRLRARSEDPELWGAICDVMNSLAIGISSSDDTIANACADSLRIAFSYNRGYPPKLSRQLFGPSESVLTHLAASLRRYSGTDQTDPYRTMRIVRAAGTVLAATTSAAGVKESGSGTSIGPARLQCADAIFGLFGSAAYRKEGEVSLCAGEALAEYSDACDGATAEWDVVSKEWPADFDADFAYALPPHSQVLFVLLKRCFLSSSPQTRTSTSSGILAVTARALQQPFTALDLHSLRQEVFRRLEVIQESLLVLLGDPKCDQLARESSCLGLACCRSIAKAQNDEEAVNGYDEEIFRAFGQTTNYGRSAYMESDAQASARRRANQQDSHGSAAVVMEPFGHEVDIGGASGISEASLGAYREMAAASLSLGRPDLLYSFLVLSCSHPLWKSNEWRHKFSAAQILGESHTGNAKGLAEVRDDLRPYLGRLIPRLLRACHDPSKSTREQMVSLWKGLTGGGAGGRDAITDHLLEVVDVLLIDTGSKLWRARAAACSALAEIIAGRSWGSLGGGPSILADDLVTDTAAVGAGVRLIRFWRCVVRAMDDIRGSVRESGERLGRSVRALSIRLCDPNLVEESSGDKRERTEPFQSKKDALAASATIVRWLIAHGLNQKCDEAAGLCVSTLVETVEVVQPRILEPVLPELLRSLLVAMSGLEPAALNYLQMRTNDQESLERARLQIAQSGPLASAVAKCINLVPRVRGDTQRKIISELDAALRLSSGFASRVATAEAVSQICAICPSAFGAKARSNPSVSLLRGLFHAVERERGSSARDRLIHCLGNLSALCPGSSVRALVARSCRQYNASVGSNNDPIARQTAAAVIRAIVVRAPHQMADGGPQDVWCRVVLPVAYLGQNDEDGKIGALWSEIWHESSGSVQVGADRLGVTLEEQLLCELTDRCTQALQDVAWARRIAGANTLKQLCENGILCPLAAASNDRDHDKRMQRRSSSSRAALAACQAVLERPSLWVGKSTVVDASVAIGSKWLLWRAACIDSSNQAERFPINMAAPAQLHEIQTGESLLPEEQIHIDDAKIIDQSANLLSDVSDDYGIESEPERREDPSLVVSPDTKQDISLWWFCITLLKGGMSNGTASGVNTEDLLIYRLSALRGLRSLMRDLPDEDVAFHQALFWTCHTPLVKLLESHIQAESTAGEKPVVVAAAVDVVAASFWRGIGSPSEQRTVSVYSDCQLFDQAVKSQSAWTVRESAALALAAIALQCHADILRHYQTASILISCGLHALHDAKYWRVRQAGLQILENLVGRSGAKAHDHSVLEALLPFKEEMQQHLRQRLTDNEPKVTEATARIIEKMSLWP